MRSVVAVTTLCLTVVFPSLALAGTGDTHEMLSSEGYVERTDLRPDRRWRLTACSSISPPSLASAS